MTTQINFHGSGGSYKTSKGGESISKGQVNFQGGGASRKSKKGPQMNFVISAGIKAKEDPGQGQKSGTGCNNGF
jgi:hypothetical protein